MAFDEKEWARCCAGNHDPLPAWGRLNFIGLHWCTIARGRDLNYLLFVPDALFGIVQVS
jgi:hypothetical protein